MRVTLRNKNTKDYWNDRWKNAPPDALPSNDDFYPMCFVKDLIQRESLSADGQFLKHKFLEAGCGNGRIMHYCASRNIDITGIDYSVEAVNNLNAHYPELKVTHDNIFNTSFQDGVFNCVFAFGLYHNFCYLDAKRALIETNRIMKNDAVLCCSFRADNLQSWLIDLAKSSRSGATDFHKLNLRRAELHTLLTEGGFDVEEIIATQNVPLLYQFRIFRHKTQKDKNEAHFRSVGPKLNHLGRVIHGLLVRFFPDQMCNNFTAICRARSR